MMVFSIFLLLFFSNGVNCFNFDMDYPIIFEEPTTAKGKSYFGYTVAMYPGDGYNSEWIRIGAPKANDSTLHNVEEPGTVYNCQVNKECMPIKFPQYKFNEKWDHAWIGATMDVSYRFKRQVVCGFRQIYIIGTDYRSMGSCFWSYLNSSSFHKIDNLLNPEFGLTPSERNKPTAYLYGQGEAGFSAHFPENINELILGAPGVSNWAGTPLRVTDYIFHQPDPSRRRRSRDVEPLKTVEVPATNIYNAFKLYGYSVTSGYYYGKHQLYYATGSPKENAYKGKIVTFKFNGEQAIQVQQNLIGEQFGEYFGASIASGDVNYDNFDDIIVGAPFYKGNTYNEGRIYVFLGGQPSLTKSTILNGQDKNGQFGTSIMFMGDLDGDGYGEVAIGSPYENDNTGSIYIYKGYANGLETIPSQKIIGKEVCKDLLGFGITISKAVDMDKNGFRDVAIGSHLSGHAVLLRSRPIVTVKHNFTSIPNILQLTTKSFLINICFSYSQFDGESLVIKYAISLDEVFGRAFIGSNNTVSTKVTVIKNSLKCKNISVTILNTTLDVQMPIQASLTYALDSPRMTKSLIYASSKVHSEDKFCIRCPVLNKRQSSPTFFKTEIPFTLGCASTNVCESELNVNVDFPELRNHTLLLGSRQYLKMKITVSNLGENAYSAKLNVMLPNPISFRQTPTRCKSENAVKILCDIANPLANDTSKSIDFDLDVKNLDQDFSSTSISIYTKISTSSNNRNKDTMSTSLELSREADIAISGKTEQEENYYGSSSVNSSVLTHIYTVEKSGVTSLNKLEVRVRVPYIFQNEEDEQLQFLTVSTIEAIFAGQPIVCSGIDGEQIEEKFTPIENSQAKRRRRQVEIFKDITDSNDKEDIKINDEEINIITNKTLFLNCTNDRVICFDIVCTFGPYNRGDNPATIRLKMNVKTKKLAGLAKDKQAVLISTTGEVLIISPKNFVQTGNSSDKTIISSIYINDDNDVKVALWIIILGVLIGLILLALLIFALVKAGFFKRTKKEELENLKAAVNQEAKILEIVEYSKSADDEMEQEQQITNEVDSQSAFEGNTSKENLVDM